jgi:hypothetical protein
MFPRVRRPCAAVGHLASLSLTWPGGGRGARCSTRMGDGRARAASACPPPSPLPPFPASSRNSLSPSHARAGSSVLKHTAAHALPSHTRAGLSVQITQRARGRSRPCLCPHGHSRVADGGAWRGPSGPPGATKHGSRQTHGALIRKMHFSRQGTVRWKPRLQTALLGGGRRTRDGRPREHAGGQQPARPAPEERCAIATGSALTYPPPETGGGTGCGPRVTVSRNPRLSLSFITYNVYPEHIND